MLEINNLNSDNINFTSLKRIPPKAYKIAGQSLRDSEAYISKLANDNKQDIYIFPKKGLISKIKSLVFFVSDEGKKTGRWFSLSIDPKKLLPTSDTSVNGYKTVDVFTPENIQAVVNKASQKQLDKKGFELNMSSATGIPVDVAYLAKILNLV